MRPMHLAQLDTARPALIMTREIVRPHMSRVTVVLITTTIRGLSTEVAVGQGSGPGPIVLESAPRAHHQQPSRPVTAHTRGVRRHVEPVEADPAADPPGESAATRENDSRLRPPSATEVRRDTSRVEAFSDGVFAVAITLLVLNLVVPPHQPGGLLHALGDLWPAYLAYLASFLFVGVSWVNHHALFRRIRSMDRGLSWVNLVLLLTVVPTPFPTAVLADALREGNALDSNTAAAFYGLVLSTDAIAWFFLLTYAGRHPHLLHHESDAKLLRVDGLRALLGIVSYGGAGLLGFLVSPLIALVIFVCLPVFYGLTSEGLRGAPAITRRRR